MITCCLPNLVHDQLAPITSDTERVGGKTIEFRKYAPLPAYSITRRRNSLVEIAYQSGTITATVKQYGDYIELSDVLLLTAIDNNLRRQLSF